MKLKLLLLGGVVAIVALLTTACKTEAPVNDNALGKILGKWELVEAYRNGNPTESLDELYFEFYEDGGMETNILGSAIKVNYSLDGEKIMQTGGDLDIDYTINSVNDSLLDLSTNLRRYNFRFLLARKVEAE